MTGLATSVPTSVGDPEFRHGVARHRTGEQDKDQEGCCDTSLARWLHLMPIAALIMIVLSISWEQKGVKLRSGLNPDGTVRKNVPLSWEWDKITLSDRERPCQSLLIRIVQVWY